jgi:tetratricopeptide (TPR) repeat protein
MKRRFIYVLFIVIIFTSQFIFSQTSGQLVAQGDSLISSFNDQGALQKYQQADKLSPNNWDILWRLSRVYVNIANEMPDQTDDQKDAQLAEYQKAFDLADRAVKLAPDKSVTYLRRAIAGGKIALFKGVFSVGGVVNAAKDDCEKAISLGNGGNYIQAIAHYVLARSNAKVSEKSKILRWPLGLSWADNETAIVEYKKAISLYPNFRMFYLDYARSLIREDDYTAARDMLNKVLTSPKQEEDDDQRIVDAKNLLAEIKDK